MTTAIATVAASLAAVLEDLTLGQPFDVVQAFRPSREISDLETLTLTVMPRSIERNSATRSHENVDYLLDVGVQQKLTDTDEETKVAALVAITTTVADTLYGLRLDGFTCIETKIDPVHSEGHLQNARIFTSIATGRFRSMTN